MKCFDICISSRRLFLLEIFLLIIVLWWRILLKLSITIDVFDDRVETYDNFVQIEILATKSWKRSSVWIERKKIAKHFYRLRKTKIKDVKDDVDVCCKLCLVYFVVSTHFTHFRFFSFHINAINFKLLYKTWTYISKSNLIHDHHFHRSIFLRSLI